MRAVNAKEVDKSLISLILDRQGKQEDSNIGIEGTVPQEEVVEIKDTGVHDRSTSNACSITPQISPPVKLTPPDKTKCSPVSLDWNGPFAFRRSYSLPVSALPMQYVCPRYVSVSCYSWPSYLFECCIGACLYNAFTVLYVQCEEMSTSSRFS